MAPRQAVGCPGVPDGVGETVRSVWSVARRRGARWPLGRVPPDNAATGRNGRAGFYADGLAQTSHTTTTSARQPHTTRPVDIGVRALLAVFIRGPDPP